MASFTSQEEIDACRDAFLSFDKDRSGTIDAWELRQVLESMGQKPTDEEVFNLIALVDDNMSNTIDFPEFLKLWHRPPEMHFNCIVYIDDQVIKIQKQKAKSVDDESDILDAYVACGGKPDKSGHVHRDTLVKIIKKDFGLPIDIEELVNKVDTSGNGEIEYEEFKQMLLGRVL